MASKMIGQRLVTKQTTKEGQLCEEVMIAKDLDIHHEYYFSITLDRITNVDFKLKFFLSNLALGSYFDWFCTRRSKYRRSSSQ